MTLIWTKEKCRKEALKYDNRTSFRINSGSSYNRANKNNWLNEICKHMTIIGNRFNRAIYCFEFSNNSVYIGLTYNLNKRKSEHLTSKRSTVYNYINDNNIVPNFKQLSDYCSVEQSQYLEEYYLNKYIKDGWNIINKNKTGSIGGSIIKWDYESCKNEALKYNNKTSFSKNSPGAYKSSKINNWFSDITNHMIIKMKKNYWNKEKCHKESIKYPNRNQFKINSCDAYSFAYRNNFLDEICSHMIRKHIGFRGTKKMIKGN